MAPRPISSRRLPSGSSTGCLVVFFSIFALIGSVAFVAMLRQVGRTEGPPLRYLIALFPLIFVTVGVGGIVWALRAGKRAAQATVSAAASPFGVPPPAPEDSAPRELRPVMTPLGKFLGITFVALFWNGLVSVFVVMAFKKWQEGQPDGCMTLFLVPFVLIGLALIYATFRQLLVLFNPRVHLTLAPGVLMVGGMAYLQWRLTGRGGGVTRLRIVLEGREEARYRRGTNTYTDRNVFVSVPVVDTSNGFEIPAGNARVDVPAGTLPSFEAEHNKIIWQLKVCCEIPNWPDSEDEYKVLVRPGFGGAA
jgi:hypothetical protein